MKKKTLALLLLSCFCLALAGCGTVRKTVEKADQWVRDNMW